MTETGMLHAVLLPGMDGTGRMFGPLLAQLPPYVHPVVLDYPRQEVLSYAQLCTTLLARLPDDAPIVLIAESFAGPLALLLSEQVGPKLKAVVLCATFVSNPRPLLARLAPLLLHESMLSLPPQKWMARIFITGFDAPDAMLEQMLAIHKQVSPRVIKWRLREVIKLDVRQQLLHCRVPLLHLYAKHDRLILQGATREIQALRPDIRSIGIDGPHFLLQTRPKKCVSRIETFLREEGIVI